MKQISIRFIAIIFSITLFLVLLLTSVEIIVFNPTYYKNHYEKRNITEYTKMNLDDLMKVTDKIIKYLKDDIDNINIEAEIAGVKQEVFGEREKAHMVDVKHLFVNGEKIRNFAFLILLIIFIVFFLIGKKYLIILLGNIKYVFIFLFSLKIIIGILLISNFTKYFTIFHLIFFDNDLWLLDPRTDILINMVPEEFFFSTAMYIIGLFTFLSVLCLVGAEYFKKKLSKDVVDG